MTGPRRLRRTSGRGRLRVVLATLAIHAAGAAAATSPIRAAPYNPTRILQPPNSDFIYIFSPTTGSTSNQGSLRAVPLNASFTTSAGTATDSKALPGKQLSATLPFLQDGVNTPYTPLLDPATGALTVIAGPCASGAVGAQTWQFGSSAPGSRNDGSGGTWRPMNTTLGGVSVAGGSSITNGGSGLSGSNFLAGGITFASSGTAGGGPSYYIFGGMCPYAQTVATTPTGWVSEANYYNTMLTLAPATPGSNTTDGADNSADNKYRLSAVASLGQPIAEAGFTITSLTRPGSVPGSHDQEFLLLGGHTQAAFLNMSQVALFVLPQQNWAFFPVVQPAAPAIAATSTPPATATSTAKADLRAFRQAVEARDASPPPALVEPRSGHTAVLSEDGSCVIVFGGWVGDTSNAAQPQLAILKLGPGYGNSGSQRSGNWEWTIPDSSQGPSLPDGVAGIYGHGATMLPGGVMMIVGGFQIPSEAATGASGQRKGRRADSTASGDSVLLYNVSSNSWVSRYTSPNAATSSSSTVSGSPTSPTTGATSSSTAAPAGTTTTQSQQTGLGVGIGLGIFIVVGLIIGAFWLARRRREQQAEDQRRRDSLTPSSYDGDHHQDADGMLQGHQYESYLEKSSGDGTPGSGRRVGSNGFFQDRERVASSGHSQRGLGADAGGDGQDAAGVVTPQMAMHPGNGASPVTAGSTGLFVDVPSPTRGLRRGLAGRPYLYHAAPRSSAPGIASARPGITTTGTSASNAAAAGQQQPHYYGPLLGQNAIHPIVEREDEDDSSSVHRRRRRHPQHDGEYSDVSDLESEDEQLGNGRRYYSNPPFSPSVASSRQMMEEIERSLAGTPEPGATDPDHQPLLLRSPVSPIANPFLDPEVLPLPNPLGSHPLTPRRSPELLPLQESHSAIEEQKMPEAAARVRPLSFVGSSNSSSSNRSGGVTVVPSPLRHNRSDASSTADIAGARPGSRNTIAAVGGARENWAPAAFSHYTSDNSSVPSSGRTSPTKTLLSDDRTGSTLSERSHRSHSSATSIARTMSTRTGALLCAAAYASAARKPGNVADKVAAMEERLNSAGGGTTKTVRTTTTMTAESVDFDSDARTETMSSVGKMSSIGKRATPAKQVSTQDFFAQHPTPSTAGGGVPVPAFSPAGATITAEKSTDSFATARTTFAQLQSEGEALLGGAKPAANAIGNTTPSTYLGAAAAGGSGASPTSNRANSPRQAYPPSSYDPTAGMHSSSTQGRRHRSGASSNGGGMTAGAAAQGGNGGGLWGSGGAGGWVSSLRRALTALSVSERSFSMTSSVVPGGSGEDSHGLLHSGSGGPYSHHRGTSSPLASPTPGSRFHLRPTNNSTPTPASRAAARNGGLHSQTASSSPTRNGIGGGSKSGPRRTVSAGSTLLLKQKRGQKDWTGPREDMYDLDLDAAQHLLRSPIVSPVRADRPATAELDDYRDDWGAPRSSFEVRQAESEWDVEGAATGREVQVLSFTVPKARLRVVNADIRAERASLRSLSEGAVSSSSGSRPGSLKRPDRAAAEAPAAVTEKPSSTSLKVENQEGSAAPPRRPSPLSAVDQSATEEHARVPRRLSRVPQVDESQGRRWNRWAGTEAPPTSINGSELSTVSAPPAAHSISRSPEREKLYRISTSEVGSGRRSPFDKKLL